MQRLTTVSIALCAARGRAGAATYNPALLLRASSAPGQRTSIPPAVATCRPVQAGGAFTAAIDAMTELAKSFEPTAIEAHWGPLWEKSGVYQPTLDIAPHVDPQTADQARFSLHYMVASALVHGSVRLSAFEPARLVLQGYAVLDPFSSFMTAMVAAGTFLLLGQQLFRIQA